MIEEVGGCLGSLMKGTIYVFSIVIGAVIIVVLGIAVLGGIYQYLMFILRFDAFGVLLGLLAPFILLFSGLFYLSWWASRKEKSE